MSAAVNTITVAGLRSSHCKGSGAGVGVIADGRVGKPVGAVQGGGWHGVGVRSGAGTEKHGSFVASGEGSGSLALVGGAAPAADHDGGGHVLCLSFGFAATEFADVGDPWLWCRSSSRWCAHPIRTVRPMVSATRLPHAGRQGR